MLCGLARRAAFDGASFRKKNVAKACLLLHTYLAPLPLQHNHAVLPDFGHPRPRHDANA